MEYLELCSKMSYELSTSALRKLAYDMAEKNNVKVLKSWLKNICAAFKCVRDFLQRNNKLIIRKPEASVNESDIVLIFPLPVPMTTKRLRISVFFSIFQ